MHDTDAAIAEFIRKKGVTRCPTAYVLPTRQGINSLDDIEQLREYVASQKKARDTSTERQHDRAAQYAIKVVLPAVVAAKHSGNTTYAAIASALNATRIESPKGAPWKASTMRHYMVRYQQELTRMESVP